MHAHLAVVKVGVAERGRDVNNRAGLIAFGLLGGNEALKLCQREREERGVARADKHGLIAIDVAAGVEGHNNQLLGFEPFHGFLAYFVEVIAVYILEAGLVGGLVVRDAHAVRVAAAHIILGVVDTNAILGADNGRLGDFAFAGDIINNIVFTGTAGAEYHFVQLGLGGRDENALAFLNHVLNLGRPGEFAKQSIHNSFSYLPFQPDAQAFDSRAGRFAYKAPLPCILSIPIIHEKPPFVNNKFLIWQ